MTRTPYGEISFEVDEKFVDYTVVNYVHPSPTSSTPLLTINPQALNPSQITVSRRSNIIGSIPLELYAAHQLEILQAGDNRCEIVNQSNTSTNTHAEVFEQVVTVSNDDGTFQQVYFWINFQEEIIVICGSAPLGVDFEDVKSQATSLMNSLVNPARQSLAQCA